MPMPLTPLPRRLFAVFAVLALTLGLLAPAAGVLAANPLATPAANPSATPSPGAGTVNGCSTVTPTFEYTIDPAGSAPLSPLVQFRVDGLALPAAGRFYWGNGEYGVAALNQVGGGTEFLKQVQPVYSKPGPYTFTSNIIDHCGTTFNIDYPVAMPVTLPTTLTLPCPGTTDVNGFCLVPLNKPMTFTVGGGPDTGWLWAASGPTEGRSITRTFTTLGEFWVQARLISKTGMIISPILKVAPSAPTKPRITVVNVPDQVNADQPFTASFVVPAGAETAKPSVYADGAKVSDTISAQITFKAGTHVLTFVLTFPDDSTVSRQAGVIAVAPPPPPPPEGPNPLLLLGGILGGGLLLGLLLLILLLLARRWRQRRANNLLAAHGRWLRQALLAEGWTLEGPTRVVATEEQPAQTVLVASHGRVEFKIVRPRKEEKWVWQDLLYSIVAELGGIPLPLEDEDPDWDIGEM